MATQDLKLSKLNSLYIKRRSSLSNYNPTERAFRNSISKGVKYGDISMISKKQSDTGVEEHVSNIADEKTEEAFDSIRKKYDKLKKETIAKERSIEKMKQTLQRAKEEEEIYLNKKNHALSVSGDLQRKTVESRLLLQEKQMQKKSFLNIQSRLKSDIKYFNDKGLSLELEYKQLSRLSKSCSNVDTTMNAQSLRTKGLLQVLRYELEKQNRQMENHLMSIQTKVDEIQSTNHEFEMRDNEIREIAERAIQDKDQNQKWWRRALLTNKLVNKFLQNKMIIEMEKFTIVETAFKNIKIATGVQDGPTMVTKYIQKQKIYGRLLDQIAKSEKEIERLKGEREGLLKSKKELDDQAQFDIGKKSSMSSNYPEQIHKLTNINEKSQRIQLCSFKFNEWTNKQHKKIGICILGNSAVSTYPREQLKTSFQKYLEWLEEQVESVSPSQEVSLDIDIQAKKTKTEEGTTEAEIGENEIVQQNQLIDSYRGQRIKQDEKFFQKLRKERQEQALIQFEQEVRMKFTKIEKPKEKEEKQEPAE